ncbi:MAG: tRNA glutamyl-Q(34) synthetase GluQRS [Myxococcota bacterium]
MIYRGRYAPSPTGPLHLGNARTALLAWLDARAHDGKLVMRVEDIDTPRVVKGAEEEQLSDLRWLGLDWDEGPDVGGPHGPYRQSNRYERYEAALSTLRGMGRLFPCVCSRKDLQRLASAPHVGEEGPAYPGTCRDRFSSDEEARAAAGRAPALRFRVTSGKASFDDRVLGSIAQDVERDVGDFVLRRADGLYAYQLAVVVDDGEMGITHVVRADDLATSTPRQVMLLRTLGHAVPSYAHVPLLNGPDAARLQKREPRHTLRGLRDAGIKPESVVGWLAHSIGLVETTTPVRPSELVRDFRLGPLVSRPRWDLFPVT